MIAVMAIYYIVITVYFSGIVHVISMGFLSTSNWYNSGHFTVETNSPTKIHGDPTKNCGTQQFNSCRAKAMAMKVITGYIFGITVMAVYESYNWLFQWDYTCYKWGYKYL